MSGPISLDIETGADWTIQLVWTDAHKNPIVFTDPQMDIRQDLNPAGTIIANLDSSGTKTGTITIVSPGVITLNIPSSSTKNLLPGRGFWDLFVTFGGKRIKLAFGNISIHPHVTAVPEA
jgi:hypothetical protein